MQHRAILSPFDGIREVLEREIGHHAGPAVGITQCAIEESPMVNDGHLNG
jgi:hypothetical protein